MECSASITCACALRMIHSSNNMKCRQWGVTSQKHFQKCFQKHESLHWPNKPQPSTTPLMRFTERRNIIPIYASSTTMSRHSGAETKTNQLYYLLLQLIDGFNRTCTLLLFSMYRLFFH